MKALSTKRDALDDLYERYEAKIRRALKTPARFVRGDGDPEAEIMMVGEAPGLDEDRQGKPFVGRAGHTLNGWIETLGLQRDRVFITNTVKCHPMKNPATPDARGNDRPPTPEEILICLPVIQQEISLLRPKAIVTLGTHATRTLLDTKETITQVHGRFFALPAKSLFAHLDPGPSEEEMQDLAGIRVFPLFHPAALSHNPRLKSDVQRDLIALRKAL